MLLSILLPLSMRPAAAQDDPSGGGTATAPATAPEPGATPPAPDPNVASPTNTESPAAVRMGIVRVTATVAGAQVNIDNVDAGVAPVVKYLPPGAHTIRVAADYHTPFVRRIDVRADTTAEVRAELASGQGTVEFQVDPDGATLTFDDGHEYPTPVRLDSMPPGKYHYTLAAPGHETVQGTLDFVEGKNLFIATKLRTFEGMVDIRTTPEGARVWEAQDVLGTTPLSLSDVTPGAHRYLLDLEGYALVLQDIDVGSGQPTKVDVALHQDGTTVNVMSRVPRTQVFIDDQFVGEGANVTFKLEHGVQYNLRVKAPQYAEAERSIQYSSAKAVTLDADFQADVDGGPLSRLVVRRGLLAKPGFWATTAAVIGGGTVATILVMRSDGSPDDVHGDVVVTLP